MQGQAYPIIELLVGLREDRLMLEINACALGLTLTMYIFFFFFFALLSFFY